MERAAVDDPARRQRLALFVSELRALCIANGALPGLVNMLRAGALLELYACQQERQDRDRRDLDRMMRQPPVTDRAA